MQLKCDLCRDEETHGQKVRLCEGPFKGLGFMTGSSGETHGLTLELGFCDSEGLRLPL